MYNRIHNQMYYTFRMVCPYGVVLCILYYLATVEMHNWIQYNIKLLYFIVYCE